MNKYNETNLVQILNTDILIIMIIYITYIIRVTDCYSSTSNIDIITTFSPAISTTNLIRHNIISMFMCLDPVIIIEGKAFILVFFAHIILLK